MHVIYGEFQKNRLSKKPETKEKEDMIPFI